MIMKLEDLNSLEKEDLVLVSTRLIQGERLEDIKIIPVRVRDIVTSLHLLYCSKDHDNKECLFYEDETFSSVDHIHWTAVYHSILDMFQIDNRILSLALSYIWDIEKIKREARKDIGEKAEALLSYLLKGEFLNDPHYQDTSEESQDDA
jgi:hypothetical protein